MKITESGQLTPEDGLTIFVAEFEFVSAHNIHEAYVAINAIAAKNRKAFEDHSKVRGYEGLCASTGELINSQTDSFVAALQKTSRQKSREGILTEAIKVNGTLEHFDYLHEALINYRNGSMQAILMEPSNPMGNMSALGRTFEAIAADAMIEEMGRIEGAQYSPRLDPDEKPIGFARVLLDHET